MLTSLAEKVRQAADASELLRRTMSVRADGGLSAALGNVVVRPLRPEERRRLRQNGNRADDWDRVRVAEGFDPARVHRSSFAGDVVLGRFRGRVEVAPDVELPASIDNSTVVDAVIGHDALVRDVRLLSGYVVAGGAVLFDCGRITCRRGCAFGNGMAVRVGPEVGGRDILVYAEIDLDIAAIVARPGFHRDQLGAYAAAVADYQARAFSDRGIIAEEARICHTVEVQDSFVGCHARVEGATSVRDSTLLSDAEEEVRVESGSCVRSSLLQWGARVDQLALVERSVLLEHSHVERHGKVRDSILGPNSGVAEGEVTSCLLGPHVLAHHQSLLISTLWPGGRGNVGAGANVGSNHTSRAPDQEFSAGEGLFLGLGVNVKFPCDFSRAPYTVVACGLTLPPQKVTFPFSLLLDPGVSHPERTPTPTEIVPAWVLRENPFALQRNERKYRARHKGRRSVCDLTIFRPEIVDLMRAACRRLETIDAPKPWYTEHDIDGLGKSFLREAHRQGAIDAYRLYLRYYALLALQRRAVAASCGWTRLEDRLLAAPSGDPAWEHARRILVEELGVREVCAGLRQLPAVLEEIASGVERSRRATTSAASA